MKKERTFEGNTDRYAFDFKLCTTGKGYAQVDTSQDAWYYGTWANPFKLQVVSYCEGDITVSNAETEQEFANEIKAIKQWNDESGHRFLGIDPGFNEDLKNQFIKLGLGEYLH